MCSCESPLVPRQRSGSAPIPADAPNSSALSLSAASVHNFVSQLCDLIYAADNAENGHPSCANGWLLNEVLRKRWGQADALITTDCGAVTDVMNNAPLKAGSKEVRGNAENTSHSKRFAALSSRSLELSFGYVMDPTLVPTVFKGERQTRRTDAPSAL